MRTIAWLYFAIALFAGGSLVGCSGSTTVKPSEAEKVPADAPPGEEKPSTDEK